MRRPIVVFACAVLAPGLILGALALRSVRHHEAVLERERGRLNQAAAEHLAHAVATRVDELQREFSLRVESLLGTETPHDLARRFDERLREGWPLARVGFAVSLQGVPLSPQILDSPLARDFLVRNEAFLCKQGSVEVYAVTPKGRISLSQLEAQASVFDSETNAAPVGRARFRQVIGDAQEGLLARFLDDDLVVWVWYRTPRDASLVFGAQLNLAPLRVDLARLVLTTTNLPPGVALALLDERGQTVAVTPPGAMGDWVHAAAVGFVGQALPHWRAVAAVFDSATAQRESRRLWMALASVVVLLVSAIGVGGWIVATDARRQLDLARRKSDFVSNVSHELRTPLTSIRLFAEMLADDRVTEPARRRQHLGVIQAEAGRLHRLISNVLDFARLERGDRLERQEPVDLGAVTRQALDSFGPQLAAEGLRTETEIPSTPVRVRGDADALAQVVNNLLSNAVKYAADGRDLSVRMVAVEGNALLEVLDRGPGVPAGCEQRIFEEFFRAHDSLASGIPGAGLGLTLARQIARLHQGEVEYSRRPGGGSCFRFRIPLDANHTTDENENPGG